MDPNSMRMEVVGDPNWGRDPPVQEESQKREMNIAKKQSARWCRWMLSLIIYGRRWAITAHSPMFDRDFIGKKKQTKQIGDRRRAINNDAGARADRFVSPILLTAP